MIDAAHELPVKRQAELLDLSRSNVYYLPRPVSDADLVLMRRIDELHLNFPFAGARMLRDMLKLAGFEVGRKHVRTLMERIGIAAIYRKRNTSAPHPEHEIYPYLLRNLSIDRPNQVWASDISYIPMRRGFVYLVAIIDWATRRLLAHRVSISMTAISASMPLKRPSPSTARRRSSTPTKEANSQATTSPTFSKPTLSR